VEAAPGTYIVFARFRYRPRRPEAAAVVLEQRASFRWRDRAVR
jgi:hypothetical protein